jgi:hypothetical protein
VSLDPATGVVGRGYGVQSRVLGEHRRDLFRRSHMIGLAVEVVQVDPMALLVPHDADEFIPGHKALREKVTPAARHRNVE